MNIFKRRLAAYVFSKYDFYHSDSEPYSKNSYKTFIKVNIKDVSFIKIISLRFPLYNTRFQMKFKGQSKYMFVYRRNYTPPKKVGLIERNSFIY